MVEEERKARVAVAGTGWWATYTHLPALLARPDVEVVAIADSAPDRLRRAAESYGLNRTYTDFHEMFEREALDGVVVSAAQDAHYEIALAGLEAGCHALIEKPMVLYPNEARELVELAKLKKLEILMSHPWHYTAHVRRARELVLAGELGDVEFMSSIFTSGAYPTLRGDIRENDAAFEPPVTPPMADTNTDRRRGGGQGYIQVTHSAALSFWVTGLEAKQVSAYMHRLDLAVDVVDAISARLSNGAVGTVSSTANLGPGDGGQHTLSVYGSRGYLMLDLIAGTMLVQSHDGAVESPPQLPADATYPRFAPANNLADVILGKACNLSPGTVGQTTVNFLDAAYRSADAEGIPIAVDS